MNYKQALTYEGCSEEETQILKIINDPYLIKNSSNPSEFIQIAAKLNQ